MFRRRQFDNILRLAPIPPAGVLAQVRLVLLGLYWNLISLFMMSVVCFLIPHPPALGLDLQKEHVDQEIEKREYLAYRASNRPSASSAREACDGYHYGGVLIYERPDR
jgi:hypothetical protein